MRLINTSQPSTPSGNKTHESKKAIICIDEFGNSHLDLSKDGTFSHFVYTAIVLDEKNKENARQIVDEIRKSFRLGGVIKSKNLGDKKHFKKRLNILNYLVENLDFTIDVLVIDKKLLDQKRGGLRHKEVFYKYFQKVFVQKYNDRFESFQIYADTVGSTDYADELARFVNEKSVVRDLFNPERNFELINDQDENLVQLADLIAGSLGRVYCSSHVCKSPKDIYDVLHQRLSIERFPLQAQKRSAASIENPDLDVKIRKIGEKAITDYRNGGARKGCVRRTSLHLRLLEYLEQQMEMDSYRLTPREEILAYFKNFTEKVTEDKLRQLIRDVRYNGVLLVSHPGKSGYKLAANYNDILQNFEHFMVYIEPMLRKVEVMNEALSRYSFNEVNPLEKEKELAPLERLLAQLTK
ncbi:DUF3800 domain-containing protein [Halocola ammonii]